MRILKTWEQAHNTIDRSMILALGNFDGLHLGHQALLKNALNNKKACDVLALMVFDPHPQYILKDQGPLKITTTAELISILHKWNVDYLLQMPFTLEFAQLSPEAFIEHLSNTFPIKTLVVGYNYRFGYRAQGDTKILQELGKRYGFKVIVVPAVKTMAGQIISSTAIRSLISKGDLSTATALLGHPFIVTGTVIKGYQRGQQIGFPTANLSISQHKLLPPLGVYAGRVGTYKAVVNLGFNPTFNNTKQSLEVHLIDFPEKDLYGQTITVELHHYLRREKKFANSFELRQQIEADIKKTRTMEY